MDTISDFKRHHFFQQKSRLAKVIARPDKAGLYLFSRALRGIGVTIPWKAKMFFGDPLWVTLPEYTGETLAMYGFFEPEVVIYFMSAVNPGDVVFDIGAHNGSYTLLANRLVGETGSVHSFEPTPRTFEILRKNTKPFSKITVNNVAVWNAGGSIPFYDIGMKSGENTTKPRSFHHSFTEYSVAAVTIDAYCRADIIPNFIKIDAEQAEKEILDGGATTIGTHRPIICVEIWGGSEGAYHETVIALLREAGYLMMVWDGASIRLVTEPTPGITNYLFVPDEKKHLIALPW